VRDGSQQLRRYFYPAPLSPASPPPGRSDRAKSNLLALFWPAPPERMAHGRWIFL